MNRYFIISLTDPKLYDIIQVIFGDLKSQIFIENNTKFVAALHPYDTSDYPFLQGYKEYSEKEIKEELKKYE